MPFKNDDICIYVPLSYGNKKHAQAVIQQGQQWFGDKFKPLTEFMPFDEYLTPGQDHEEPLYDGA